MISAPAWRRRAGCAPPPAACFVHLTLSATTRMTAGLTTVALKEIHAMSDVFRVKKGEEAFSRHERQCVHTRVLWRSSGFLIAQAITPCSMNTTS